MGKQPSTCPECGSESIEPISDKPDEFVCSDCGLVINIDKENISDTDTGWKNERLDLGDSVESGSIESGSTDHVHWSEQTNPAIVGLIKEPERTYHEYYRIENPKEFFEDCSTEEEELQRIRKSDLEPFETLDLPDIEWRYSVY